MLRLVFSDLRDHVATWIGAFIIAVGCGFIGGFVANVQQTALFYTGQAFKIIDGSVIAIVTFSVLAAVVVLISSSNLTVSVQRRSYALWQLVNMKPRRVSQVVIIQLVVVSLVGSIVGVLLSAAFFTPLFHWVYATYDFGEPIELRAGLGRMPAVCLAVAAVFVAGGLKGARNAAKTPPLTVLREPDISFMKMSLLRWIVFVGLFCFTGWTSLSTFNSTSPEDTVKSTFLFLTLTIAVVIPVAPVLFRVLMSAWTALVPQTKVNAWYLARHTARYGLSISTSVETPIMVCFAVVASTFSLTSIMGAYAQTQGLTDMSTDLDFTSSILLLGGPVLLCALGAAVSVIMSSGSRTRDVALLSAAGALPKTLVVAAICEAFIHSVNATLVGIVDVIAFNAITTHALHLPLFGGMVLGQGVIVCCAGFVLVLAATFVPTLMALRRETASVLAMQE